MNAVKGWKTIVVAVAVFVLGILQSTGFTDFLTTFGLNGNGNLTMVIGGLMGILRFFTTTPILKNTTPSA